MAVSTPIKKHDASYIPEAIVTLSSDYAVLVDKKMQKLYTFHRNGRGIEKVFEASCSTGKNNGPKMMSGDGKTPEGILYATKHYRDSQLSTTYGCMAFDLNYPNLMDRKAGRNGNNIWIHGTDKKLRTFQSNGCITLTNQNITHLANYIKLHETPIIIKDHISWVSEQKILPIKNELLTLLDVWIKAVKDGNPQELESLYDDEYLGDSESLSGLTSQFSKWNSSGTDISLHPANVSILKHDQYVVMTFDQIVSYKDFFWNCGSRKLFLHKKGNEWNIAGDTLQSPMMTSKQVIKLRDLDETIAGYTQLEDTIHDWLKSWEAGDMEKYGSYYTADFKGRGMDRKRWISYKTGVNNRSKNIRITASDMKIMPASHDVTVIFKQEYHSSGYTDTGIKKLRLKKVQDQWMIYRESWKKL